MVFLMIQCLLNHSLLYFGLCWWEVLTSGSIFGCYVVIVVELEVGLRRS